VPDDRQSGQSEAIRRDEIPENVPDDRQSGQSEAIRRDEIPEYVPGGLAMIIVRAFVAGLVVQVTANPERKDASKIIVMPSDQPCLRSCCLTVSYVPILVPPKIAARTIVVSSPR